VRAACVLIAILAAGCLSKPGFAEDWRPPPVPRFISKAYAGTQGQGTSVGSPGMSLDGYQISTAGIEDGDLVLFIANVDNGSDSVWPDPVAPGFTQLYQSFYNGGDGQTYVVDWKIADHEPATYAGQYGQGKGSSAATIALIAVTGYLDAAPINASAAANELGQEGAAPATATSDGVNTSVPNTTLIWAYGSDWLGSPGNNTFAPPAGFTELVAFGDHGGNGWDWTSQEVSYRANPSSGPTGTISGTLMGSQKSTPWEVLIAIAGEH
jgi:hypothetical protein